MFLTHHWLDFILLVVLISPVCAAPALRARNEPFYNVQMYDESGTLVTFAETETEGRNYLLTTIIDVWIYGMEPSDIQLSPHGRKINFESSSMLYYKLVGGFLCSPPRICYGYVVTAVVTSAKKQIPQNVIFSAIVRGHIIHPPYLTTHNILRVHGNGKPLRGEQLKNAEKLQYEKYSEFLTKFALVKGLNIDVTKEQETGTKRPPYSDSDSDSDGGSRKKAKSAR
ncbi:hypothetical protein BDP27DRAFT_1426355 [Rhodocollybia butyracea]|uniref:Uncharacterized protein n=1 Tax=Rhodocollybia butyracea TaxID=206335 RepID=A0A9P5U2J2_9AGAR|nr:hypothetical protein BDP27DRAFT_1426355 [Rhodocollybia butyracea]